MVIKIFVMQMRQDDYQSLCSPIIKINLYSVIDLSTYADTEQQTRSHTHTHAHMHAEIARGPKTKSECN